MGILVRFGSEPAVVKYGVCVNVDDADAYEEEGGG